MNYIEEIQDYLTRLQATIAKLDQEEINQVLQVLLMAYETEATVFIFGNGGSASTASHFGCDLNKGVSWGLEKRFKIFPLTDNFATISAYSNDVTYDDVFIEQLKNFLKPGDIVIGISGSGNSKNIIKAMNYAHEQGNTTIGLTGYTGGKLKEISDYSINANIADMQISEDIHMILCHLLMQILKKVLNP